jgi:signal transduction histidine kinase
VLVLRFLARHFTLLEQRASELEYFATQIAHDIFNPLTPIQMTLDLCLKRAPDETLRVAADRGLRNAKRLRNAAEALSAFARAAEPPAATDRAGLRECVESAAASLAPSRTIDVGGFQDCVVLAKPAVVDALIRVFLRELERESPPDAALSVAVRELKGGVRVEVRALCVAEARQMAAGERFAPRIRGPRSGSPGIDLELFAARRIVEAHDGEVGAGSWGPIQTLWFELPVAA